MPVRGAGRKKGTERVAEEQEEAAPDAVAESYGAASEREKKRQREAGEGLAKTQLMASINKTRETGIVARDL